MTEHLVLAGTGLEDLEVASETEALLRDEVLLHGEALSFDIVRRGQLRGQRTHDDDWEFEALCLVNGHHLHMSFGERLVGIFVVIDPAVVEEPQETVELVS